MIFGGVLIKKKGFTDNGYINIGIMDLYISIILKIMFGIVHTK